MHPKPRVALLAALVVAVIAAIFLAARGGAAGIRICPASGPSCLTASLLPGTLRVGGTGVLVARFTNEANSTATHTLIKITLPGGTTATGISSSPAATCVLSTLSCNFGNVKGHQMVKVFVQFTVQSASSSAVGSAHLTIDEGNNTSPTVDTVDASTNGATFSNGASTNVNGNCTNGGGSLSATIPGQAITATFPAAHGSLHLPCTPVDTGILGTLAGFSQHVTFVDFPLLSGSGNGTVVLDFQTLPTGKTFLTFQLFEVPASGSPFAVPACVGGNLPTGRDACIQSQTELGDNDDDDNNPALADEDDGAHIVLLVQGTGGDPKFVG
jgi:hypothetical protein